MAQEIRGTSISVDLAGAATSGAAHTGTLATRVRIVNELASGLNTVVIGAVAATADREVGLTYSFKLVKLLHLLALSRTHQLFTGKEQICHY